MSSGEFVDALLMVDWRMGAVDDVEMDVWACLTLGARKKKQRGSAASALAAAENERIMNSSQKKKRQVSRLTHSASPDAPIAEAP